LRYKQNMRAIISGIPKGFNPFGRRRQNLNTISPMDHPKLQLTLPWEDLELSCQQQIIKVLALPELELLAIMPDAHTGYDLCIGGVALLRGAVSPSFVGYDIGCGMCHVNTGLGLRGLGLEKPEQREALFRRIQETVPAGLGKKQGVDSGLVFTSASRDKGLEKKVEPSVKTQLGTLGSGNHFLEIGVNPKGEVGVTLHSGSRRAGYDIASWYMRKGRLLKLSSELGQAYMADMHWALDFALENRRVMLRKCLECMGLAAHDIRKLLAPGVMINETHNHAAMRGKNSVLHRKGATPAEAGQTGIIPANQKDGVWITRGLGNEAFLCSASHGAGRLLSRKAASHKGSVADMQRAMKGIVCRTDKGVLDEGPWAYKSIKEVLAAQDGVLVDITDHFKPVIVLKG
jgi:Uncharacterized conserved protein